VGSLESTTGGRLENENLFKVGGVINHEQAQGEVKFFG